MSAVITSSFMIINSFGGCMDVACICCRNLCIASGHWKVVVFDASVQTVQGRYVLAFANFEFNGPLTWISRIAASMTMTMIHFKIFRSIMPVSLTRADGCSGVVNNLAAQRSKYNVRGSQIAHDICSNRLISITVPHSSYTSSTLQGGMSILSRVWLKA